MKKISLFIFLLLSLFACEKDDICIDPTTPNLIIRLYDFNADETVKSVFDLQIKNIDQDSIFKDNITVADSITIPLNVNQDFTSYVFTINTNDASLINSDTLKISYSREEVFVSRSCGFKVIFKNLNLTLTPDSNNWIQSVVFIDPNNTIDNEKKAHVKILH